MYAVIIMPLSHWKLISNVKGALQTYMAFV